MEASHSRPLLEVRMAKVEKVLHSRVTVIIAGIGGTRKQIVGRDFEPKQSKMVFGNLNSPWGTISRAKSKQSGSQKQSQDPSSCVQQNFSMEALWARSIL